MSKTWEYLNLFSPIKEKFIKLTQSYHIAETAYKDGLCLFITQYLKL